MIIPLYLELNKTLRPYFAFIDRSFGEINQMHFFFKHFDIFIFYNLFGFSYPWWNLHSYSSD